MKRLFLLVAACLVGGFAYLYSPHLFDRSERETVAAPDVTESQPAEPSPGAVSAGLDHLKSKSQKSTPKTIKSQPPQAKKKPAVKKRTGKRLSKVKAKTKPKKPNLAPKPQIKDEQASSGVIPASIQPKKHWIPSLSGESVQLNVGRHQTTTNDDCHNTDCPEPVKDFSVAGVVVESEREKRPHVLHGNMEVGDARDRPLVYVK